MNTIRLVIADDHAIVREGLQRIMAATDDLVVVGVARNGDEIQPALDRARPDVLLLDLNMPGLNWVTLLEQLHAERPDLPVLVLSMHNEGQIVQRALKAGVAGYVTKDSEPGVLQAALRKVAGGGRFVDPALVDTMVNLLAAHGVEPHDTLTAREFQILRLITAGTQLGEIAKQLHLSPKTISTHKMRLMQKLGVDNNADLVRYAIRHGIASG